MERVTTVLLAACLAIPQFVYADTVDNPGPFTITARSGHLKVGSGTFDINPNNPPSLAGTIDSSGVSILPAESIIFPDAVISVPFIGNVTVRIQPLSDGSGGINALTGDGDATISLRVRLINSLLGPNCRIEPVNLTATTGSSGLLQGVLYDQTVGTATFVSNDFSVPRSTGCNFGTVVDGQLGLPSDPPNNEVVLGVSVDPILTGS